MNVDATGKPLKLDCRVIVLPPAIEPLQKTFTFSFREGSEPKALPSMETKAGLLRMLPEGRLEVAIVSGLEDTDELDIMDKEYDSTTHLQVFKHKSAPIAWWPRPAAGEEAQQAGFVRLW